MLRNILIILLFVCSVTFSQFKDKNEPTIHDGITNYSPSGFLTNFFNPNNFQMNHSVSMSYTTMRGNGVALSTYTNNMTYKFSENLNMEVDASLVASPYSSFGQEHQNSINGIYLSRAQLNYSPTKNMYLSIQYLRPPPGSFYYGNSNGIFSTGRRRFGTGF